MPGSFEDTELEVELPTNTRTTKMSSRSLQAPKPATHSGTATMPSNSKPATMPTNNRTATTPSTHTGTATMSSRESEPGEDAIDLEAWIPTGDAWPLTEEAFRNEAHMEASACYAKLQSLWVAYRAQCIMYEKEAHKSLQLRQQKALLQAELDVMKRVEDPSVGVPVPGRGESSTPMTQASQAGHRYTPRMPDPPALSDGKSPTFDAWVLLMRQKLRANADHFPDSRSEVEYVFSRCEGEAASHLVAPMQDLERFEVVEDIIEYLTQIYRNPHQQMLAMKALRDLKMKVGDDFQAFASEYRRLATEAQIPESQWVSDFYHKLLDTLQTVMIGLYANYRDGSFTSFVSEAGIYAIQQKHIQESRAARENARKARGTENRGTTPKPHSKPRESRDSSAQPQTNRVGGRHAGMVCFNCQEEGHISRFCPKRKGTVRAVAEGDDEDSGCACSASEHAKKRVASRKDARRGRKGDEVRMIAGTIPEVCNELSPLAAEAALVARIKLSFGKHSFETSALLDTGATITTDGIIDYSLAQRLSKEFGLPLKETVKKSAYRDFQGRMAQAPNRLFLPRMTMYEHEQPSVVLACMDLGAHSVILGEKWLREHGMTLSPPHGAIMHDPRFCTHIGTLEQPRVWKLKEVPKPAGEGDFEQIKWPKAWTKREARTDGNPEAKEGTIPSGASRCDEQQGGHDTPGHRPPNRTIDLRERIGPAWQPPEAVVKAVEPQWKVKILSRRDAQEKRHKEKPAQTEVKFISAKAFIAACKEKGAEVSIVDVQAIAEIIGNLTEKDFVESNAQKLPEVYRDLIKVVSRAASDTLPEHTDNDCRIELLEGKTPEMIGAEPLRRYTAAEYKALREFVMENLGNGFVRPSAAGWGSPPLMVKKPDGTLRVCIDYRRLNALMKRDAYPLPLIDQILTLLRDTKVMTKMDIRHAFYRTRMDEDSEDLTTFRTPMGAYCFRVMPMGITNGPSVFQRYINKALAKCGLGHTVVAYADDVVVFSKDEKQHVQDVRKVMQALIDANLQVDLKKCEFHVTETKLLGLIVSTKGLRMDPAKVEAILNWRRHGQSRTYRSSWDSATSTGGLSRASENWQSH